ncbi:GntR family transcriptional regulator [uncultured Solobacterium sp.]|jgi:hypothetical protein|uniref:GntR family transcriptional regulator n=1 Tax=uncultured Solobacterium sp. TaxID=747375 RepID=UPI0026350630|nr:UTRA domain-containing protein [uncultured Solobacterium sp.]
MNSKKDIYIVRNADNNISVSEELKEKGFNYECKILTNTVIEANKLIASKLQLPIASKVCSFRKLRIVDGEPISIEQVYIDLNQLPDLPHVNLTNKSFYEWLLTTHDVKVTRREETIKVAKADKEEAKLLNISIDEKVMMLEGISFRERQIPFEYYQVICIPGFYHYRSVNYESE